MNAGTDVMLQQRGGQHFDRCFGGDAGLLAFAAAGAGTTVDSGLKEKAPRGGELLHGDGFTFYGAGHIAGPARCSLHGIASFRPDEDGQPHAGLINVRQLVAECASRAGWHAGNVCAHFTRVLPGNKIRCAGGYGVLKAGKFQNVVGAGLNT